MMSEQPGKDKNLDEFMMIAGNFDAPQVYSPNEPIIGDEYTQESPIDIFSMMQNQVKGPSKIDLLLQPAEPDIPKNSLLRHRFVCMCTQRITEIDEL